MSQPKNYAYSFFDQKHLMVASPCCPGLRRGRVVVGVQSRPRHSPPPLSSVGCFQTPPVWVA